ncbi:acyl-CoA dehydrogenase family protein [Rhodococcus koreensis]
MGSSQLAMRRNDYSLDEQQQAVKNMFLDFFSSVATSEVVRAAEPLGFDSKLWQQATETGVVSMAIPESRGGDGATVVDLVLMAEEYGAALAPIPLVEAVTAARLLAAVTGPDTDALINEVLASGAIPTIALASVDSAAAQLVPAGAIADFALILDGADLVRVRPPAGRAQVANLGNAPLAWWDLAAGSRDRAVIASGPAAVAAYQDAVRLWKLLTGAALVGSGAKAITLAVDFAATREAFGQPVGTFQAISHSLVDAAILVEASRNLTRKTAWFLEYEPNAEPALLPSAYVSARKAAVIATTTGVHVQGGFGFTNESDMTLHFRRAKGWPLLSGTPDADLLTIVDYLPLPFTL